MKNSMHIIQMRIGMELDFKLNLLNYEYYVNLNTSNLFSSSVCQFRILVFHVFHVVVTVFHFGRSYKCAKHWKLICYNS